jgi:hypothetical protein
MTAMGHPQNPLTGYTTDDGDYQAYLAELAAVFGDVAALLRPGGYAVLNVANLTTADGVTTLAWDIGARVSRHLARRQDVFLCWDQNPAGISGDYCLIFQKADLLEMRANRESPRKPIRKRDAAVPAETWERQATVDDLLSDARRGQGT